MVRVGSDLINSFAEQEQAEARLNQTLESTGFAAGLTAGELKNLAQQFQNTTKFGDEAVIAAESVLLTFKNIGKDVFPQALGSILDVSEALGQDLQTSAIQLGKALNDPVAGIGALQRVGVSFTESQVDTIKSLAETNQLAEAQAIILGELESQFGGVAAAAAATATGGFTQLKNVAGDTKELLGGLLAEAIRPLADGFRDALLGVNQFIVAQQALKAVEEGAANIEQLRVALQERNNDLQRVATDLARTQLRIQELQNGAAEKYRGELAQLSSVLPNIEENKQANLELVQSIQAQIAVEEEAIDSAQQLAAERVAADSAAAASALDFETERREADDDTSEEIKKNIFEELEARQAAVALENAIFIAQFDARQKLREAERAAEEKAVQDRIAGINAIKAASVDLYSALGGLFVESAQNDEERARRQKIVATGMAVINTAEGITKALSASVPPFNFIQAALVGAAGAAQIATINSQSFQTGTGPQGFTVPPGFEGDSFPVRAQSGERVTVERPGEGGAGMRPIILEVDGRIWGKAIANWSDAGRVRINPRAIGGL